MSGGGHGPSLIALSPRHLTIPEAVDYVVVHHARRLHEGVADG